MHMPTTTSDPPSPMNPSTSKAAGDLRRGETSPISVVSPKIVLIDPDIEFSSIASDYFLGCGYDFQSAHDRLQGLTAILNTDPDLVIADIATPGLDYVEVLHRLKAIKQVALIVSSIGSIATDRIACLDAGADDFFAKPIALDELGARVRAILRRIGRARTLPSREALRVGNVTLNPRTRELWVKEQSQVLTPLEFDILALLMRSAGSIISPSRIVRTLCESGPVSNARSIYTTLYTLRKKLGGHARPAICTVRGRGYLLPRSD